MRHARSGSLVPTRRVLALALMGLSVLPLGAPQARAQELAGTVVELRLDGVVDPFVADYIEENVAAAQDQGALAVLLTIDTPGGLDSAMLTM